MVPMHVTCLALLYCDREIAVTVTGCVWERLSSRVTLPAPLQLAVLGPEVCGGLQVGWGWSWFGAFLGKAQSVKGGRGGVCR